MSELSLDELKVLDRVLDKPELQAHLFSKIKKLKWFNTLRDKGFLAPSNNPHPINTEGDYYSIPSWPVTQYLVGSSEYIKDAANEQYAKSYLNLILDLTQHALEHGYSNYRTWWQLAKVLRNTPHKLLTLKNLDLISYWLKDRFDSRLVSKEIADWTADLLAIPNQHNNQLALKLFDIIFEISAVESQMGSGKSESKLNIDGYTANKLAEDTAETAGAVLGIEAVELFESKLILALDIDGNDKWSAIWRRAIEDHEQNSSRDDVEAVMLKLLRDSLLGYCDANSKECVCSKLSNMLSNESQMIQRVAIYVAGRFWGKVSTPIKNKLLDEQYFTDSFRHELWTLLQNNFSCFTDNHKEQVHDVISALTCLDEDGNIEERPTAYRQSIWYSAIKELDIDAAVLYKTCVEITGKDPDHPSFSSYMSVGAVEHESPVGLDELRVMLKEPETLVSFLNDYKYKGHFREPGIEGLVKAFGELVTLERESIFKHTEHLAQLKPYYLHELFAAYSRLWDTKEELDWDAIWTEILTFSEMLLKKDEFWNNDDSQIEGVFIGNVNWVVGTLSRLIESGCKSDNHAFGIDKSSHAKRVLELILDHQSGEEFNLDSDAVSIAINSSRGRCLEAYVNLALYEVRNSNREAGEHLIIWKGYEPRFTSELDKPDSDNEFEFAAIVGTYIPNFLYLSEEWTLNHLDKIFEQSNQQRWLCAIQGYAYVGQLYPDVHSLFKKQDYFEAILDSQYLNDEVKNRYIEFICVAYVRELENITDQQGLLFLLVKRANYSELQTLVWFLWSLRNNEHIDVSNIVLSLWPKLVSIIDTSTKEGRNFASKLCLWAEYIDDLNEQTKAWLLAIAPYAGSDYNGDKLIKSLAQLSDKYPQDVYEIWKAMLTNHCVVFADESVKKIFSDLISIGSEGERYAREIADEYLKNGDSRQVELYQAVLRDQ